MDSKLELDLAGFNLGDVQDFVHQPDQPFAVLLANGQQFASVGADFAGKAAEHQVNGALDGSHRGAQFVGSGPDELRLHLIDGFLAADVVVGEHPADDGAGGVLQRPAIFS